MLNCPIFIAHGDITTDIIYDYNLNILKKDGGGCNWNVLYNLACMGSKCYALGTVGPDEEGKIAIDSLQRVNINTNYVEIEPQKRTTTFHILMPKTLSGDNSIIHSTSNPFTGEPSVTFSDNLPIQLPEDLNSNQDLYILLESIRPVNFNFINSIPSKKVCLDIGDEVVFQDYDSLYIYNFLKQVNILLLNGKTTHSLYHKLSVKDDYEFYSLLNLDLLIKTDGAKPVHFLFNSNNFSPQSIFRKPTLASSVVDNTRSR